MKGNQPIAQGMVPRGRASHPERGCPNGLSSRYEDDWRFLLGSCDTLIVCHHNRASNGRDRRHDAPCQSCPTELHQRFLSLVRQTDSCLREESLRHVYFIRTRAQHRVSTRGRE